VLIAALAACGRYDFAPLADAITGHDEDGDGIPDVIDPCPHIAGDRADADGDGVGDACDPNPTVPSEHWLLFATLQPGDQPFDDPSVFAQDTDSLHLDTAANPRITRTVGTIRLDVGYDIHALVGTGQHQIAAGVDNAAATVYYFGELNDNGTNRDVSVVSYDVMNGYQFLAPQAIPGLHAGSGSFRLDAVATAPPAYHLVAGWVGEMYTSDAATPAYIGGTDIRFAINGLDLDLRYVAIIATD